MRTWSPRLTVRLGIYLQRDNDPAVLRPLSIASLDSARAVRMAQNGAANVPDLALVNTGDAIPGEDYQIDAAALFDQLATDADGVAQPVWPTSSWNLPAAHILHDVCVVWSW